MVAPCPAGRESLELGRRQIAEGLVQAAGEPSQLLDGGEFELAARARQTRSAIGSVLKESTKLSANALLRRTSSTAWWKRVSRHAS
jgi:hypothetical protein